MAARQAADGQQRGAFEVDEDRALAELELTWADGGYHGFSADGGTWCAVSSAGEVLTGGTPEALDRAIRAHWQAMSLAQSGLLRREGHLDQLWDGIISAEPELPCGRLWGLSGLRRELRDFAALP